MIYKSTASFEDGKLYYQYGMIVYEDEKQAFNVFRSSVEGKWRLLETGVEVPAKWAECILSHFTRIEDMYRAKVAQEYLEKATKYEV